MTTDILTLTSCKNVATVSLPASHGDPINILIVDDEPKNLTVLEVVLDNPGYRLIRAESAEQALLALIKEEFALIILDIRMPGMNGFELATMIKERKKTACVPIIFLTAYYNEDQHVLEGYDTGAVDYLHKPVNPIILRSKVAVFAELFRKNRECALACQALIAEMSVRRRAQEQLRELNETLERRVAERTAALLAANVELQSATTEAETASLAKSVFLSNMSHELRTPLNAILGFAQLLEAGKPSPTPDQMTRLKQILKAGWYLLDMINEILDLALIESGKSVMWMEPVSLSQVLLECQAMFEPQAKKIHIHLHFFPLDSTWFVHADPTKLKQVISNLLSNAIKYNREQGMVEVQCSEPTPGRLRISVKDSGTGLSAEQLAQLFQPFNRLGQEVGVKEGTGIGLAVSKKLVEIMGGTIGVESTVGVGSEFWIELERVIASQPAAVIKCPEEFASHKGDAARYTLLYVEDNPANLMLVEQIIEELPHIRMISARDGSRGVALAQEQQPEIILMDINLPGISGIEAMSLLRKDPATKHIPIIALSANAMPRDIDQGLKAGFFRYLTKPIKINEFTEALEAAMASVGNEQPSA
jgi:signal transduction histidine kinase